MNNPSVAYFSAEYAIADDMPIYAGGLGVLAADMVLEAAALNKSFSAIGLVYHLAFTGDDPDQRPMTERLRVNGFEVAKDAQGESILAKVLVARRTVVMQAWVKTWDRTRLILLDTNLSQNEPEDRAICDRLYASDPMLQLAQEICLGFGGVGMLRALGINAEVFHLNEGHTALAGLAVAVEQMPHPAQATLAQVVAQTRPKLVGTKHTILPGAGILLDWNSVGHQLAPLLRGYGVSMTDLKFLAGQPSGDYSDTKLLIALTHIANGVSRIHVAAELHDHPQSKLITITNGVYRHRWMAQNWGESPLELTDEELWTRHGDNRRRLFELIRAQTGQDLDPDILTVIWARRMASYKRPELLVSDMQRLKKLMNSDHCPVQFVVAGRANPSDTVGVELMQRIITASKTSSLSAKFAYLPYYNPVSAKLLVQGADLWLNTPIRGYEACGTSGMKASLNGALQLSTSDGWIDEVDINEVGWLLPDANPAKAIYDTLEQTVAPQFYDRSDSGLPRAWIQLMRSNMKLILEHFTAKRMLDDYYIKLYEAKAQD
jgi:starch phosphorylase